MSESKALEHIDSRSPIEDSDLLYRLQSGTQRFLEEMRAATSEREVAREAVERLQTIVPVDRAALLLPADQAPGHWEAVEYFGFPDDHWRELYYVRGEGLTGKTLIAERSKHENWVLSENVNEDERWSRKSPESTQGGDLLLFSFLGVPLFVHDDEAPIGCLTCMRNRNLPEDDKRFSYLECLALKNFANHVSSTLERIRVRKWITDNHQQHIALSRIAYAEKSERRVCDAALSQLCREFGFSRALLSLVNPAQSQIVGVSVVGFKERLIEDTKRILFRQDQDPPESEDILSWVCRKQRVKPFIVDLTSERDQLARYFHTITARAHNVLGRVLVVPLVFQGKVVCGVILVALSDNQFDLTEHNQTRLLLYASNLAELLQFRRALNTAHRAASRVSRLVASLQDHCGTLRSPLRVVRELFQGLDDGYGIREGFLFTLAQNRSALVGAIGYNINETLLRKTEYLLSGDTDVQFTPLVRRAYVQGDQFITIKGSGYADEMSRLGIESSNLFVAPLRSSAEVVGVLGIACDTDANPLSRTDIPLGPMLQLAALAVRLEQVSCSLRANRRQSDGVEIIRHQIGRIVEDPYSDVTGNLARIVEKSMPAFDLIVRETARLFDCQLCGLFLTDDTVKMPLPSDGKPVDPQRYLDRPFLLRAGVGYPPEAIGDIKYEAPKAGLTASVIRTLQPQRSSNLFDDHRWSKKVQHYEDAVLGKGPRTWMGIPLVFRDKRHQYLFGALTFTRGRRTPSQAFSERDERMAREIAESITLSLYNRQIVSTARQKLFKWFSHDATKSLCFIRDDYIEEMKRKLRSTSLEADLAPFCEKTQNAIDFTLASFDAYSFFGGRQLEWNRRECDIEEIADMVLEIVHPNARHVTVDTKFQPRGLIWPVDREKFVMLLFILLDNAFKAVEEADLVEDKKVTLQVSLDDTKQLPLCVVVKDNGCGFDPSLADELCKEGVYWFKGSSGLGLAILDHFVRNLAGGRVVLQSQGFGKGARFEVTLP